MSLLTSNCFRIFLLRQLTATKQVTTVKNRHNRSRPPAAAAMMMYINSSSVVVVAAVGLATAEDVASRTWDTDKVRTVVLEKTLEDGVGALFLIVYGSLQFPVTRSLFARTYTYYSDLVKHRNVSQWCSPTTLTIFETVYMCMRALSERVYVPVSTARHLNAYCGRHMCVTWTNSSVTEGGKGFVVVTVALLDCEKQTLADEIIWVHTF